MWGVEGAVSCRCSWGLKGSGSGLGCVSSDKRRVSVKSSRAGPSSSDGSNRGARAGVLRGAGEDCGERTGS